MGNQQSASSPAEEEGKRKRIVEEILSTEQSYVTSLATVAELYLMPLMQSLKSPKPLLTEEEIKGIFSDLNTILEFHMKTLRPEIQLRVEKWGPTKCIGDVFVQHSEMMKIYTMYVNNYDGVHAKIDALAKRKEIRAFLMEAKSSPRHTQLDLLSYLIMPIQRIPRYVLLLKDLQKHTPPTHPDFKNICDAVGKVQEVATFINEKKREDENMKRLTAISKSIEGSIEPPLVQSDRRPIKEGALELTKVMKRMPQQPSAQREEKKKFSLFSRKQDKKASKTGYLTKEGDFEESLLDYILSLGGLFRSWKKRWFILDGTDLAYYFEEVTGKETTKPEPRGRVDLAIGKLLSDEEKKRAGVKEEHIAIETTPGGRVLVIQEPDEKLRKEWIAEIQRGISNGQKPGQSSDSAANLTPPVSPISPAPPSEELIEGSKLIGLPTGKYYLFLFNDLVVFCQEKGGKRYTFRGKFPVGEGQSIAHGEGENVVEFSFRVDDFILEFKAGSPKEAAAWIKELKEILRKAEEDKKSRLALENRGSTIWQSVYGFF